MDKSDTFYAYQFLRRRILKPLTALGVLLPGEMGPRKRGLSGFSATCILSFGLITCAASLASPRPSEAALDVVFAGTQSATIANPNPPGSMACVQDPAGTFTCSPILHVNGSPVHASQVAAADLDGDGRTDVILVGLGTGSIFVCPNQGGALTCSTWIVDASARAAAVGDVNGDGRLDVVFPRSGVSNTQNLLCINNGGVPLGATSFNCSLFGPLTQSTHLALGDLDGDGDLDLFVTGSASQSAGGTITLFRNQICINQGGAQGGEAGTFVCTSPEHVAGRRVALGDIDSDGDLDVVLVATVILSTGHLATQFRYCLNAGNAALQCTSVGFLGAGADDLALGDVDGDGHLDAVMPDFLCTNNGLGTTGAFLGFTCGAGPDSAASGVALGDVDGDGDLDAVFAHSTFVGGIMPPPRLCTNDGSAGFACQDLPVPAGVRTFKVALLNLGAANQAPVANAGSDETVHPGTPVTLDGSGSHDPDGHTPLTFAWLIVEAPDGSVAELSDSASVTPTFTPDLMGDYRIQLVVVDTLGLASEPDEVTISTANSAPVAHAGADQVIIKLVTLVTLDGSQSYDPDGDEISYAWLLVQTPDGSQAMLSDPSDRTPTFVADVQGEYRVRLTVTDEFGAESEPSEIIVSFLNVPPVAVAGATQVVTVGTLVELDGSGSTDPNGDPLTYQWRMTSLPAESEAELSDPEAAAPTFVPDVAGTYIVQLVVSDGWEDSAPSGVTIQVTEGSDAIIERVTDAIEVINGLGPGAFKNTTMQRTLTHKLSAVIAHIEAGELQDALDKLEHDVMAKTDGCAAGGTPDKNDWLRGCDAQSQLWPVLQDAASLLR